MVIFYTLQRIFLTKAFSILDTVILNYALTLEHLENAFYSGALAQFDAKAFEDADLPPWARRRFEEVAAHEATHVQALSNALGDKATQPCTYSLWVFFFELAGKIISSLPIFFG